MRNLEEDFRLLKEAWPSALVARDQIERFSGGIITSKYIRNLDSRGLGPAERIRTGRKISYNVDILIMWLKDRSTKLEPNDIKSDSLRGLHNLNDSNRRKGVKKS
jgi:hypothetical protein